MNTAADKVHRRSALILAIALATWMTWADAAQRGTPGYPSRPVRLIVAESPGGNVDFVARLIAVDLGKRLGQQFVVGATK